MPQIASVSSSSPDDPKEWLGPPLGLLQWPALGIIAAVSIGVPLTLHLTAWLVPSLALLVAAVAWTVSRGLEPRVRTRLWQVLALAGAFQLVLWTIVTWAQIENGFTVLGLDGRRFYLYALKLASSGFNTNGQHPIAYLGTASLGHYYVFAAVVAIFGDDMLTLQLFNVALLVLATGLTYLWTSRLMPRWALAIGVLTATYTPIVVLATLDLWKDPLVILAVSMAVWGMVGILRPTENRHDWRAAVGMTTGLAFLHVTRFYDAAYLEIGALLVVTSAMMRKGASPGARALRTTLACVLVSELVPMLAGWPSTPGLLYRSVVHTLGTPAARDYSRGLVISDDLEAWGPLENDRRDDGRRPLQLKIDRSAGRVLVPVANTIRRLFGPFAWIMPQGWTPEILLENLYLNYPGMVLWYALLPFVAVGLVSKALKFRTFVASEATFVALAVFLSLYFAQYLVMNLAYRQRDTMFPLLLPFAAIAYERFAESRAGRRAYVAYLIALACLATAHLVVRASLGS